MAGHCLDESRLFANQMRRDATVATAAAVAEYGQNVYMATSEYAAMSQPEERETVQRYFLSQPPGRILDIPSGNLWLSRPLAQHGFECHAADLYCDAPPAPNIHWQRVDMDRPFPYADEFFDYIACVEGVEHMENVHHLLRECARVLRSGGKLMLTTPNVLTFKSRLRYLLRGTFFGFPHIVRNVSPGEHLHINPVSISLLQLAARRSGLHLERVHPFPMRRKDWVYLPGALLVHALTKLGLLCTRRRGDYENLHALLVSPTILLSDVLIVSFSKP
jgi:2-polyprenyl-3-methyl-5-hydroxy-6-metoxy-1,4-benzoquinol methylase